VLFTSSTAVYAQTDGAWVDETSPAEAEHFSGRRLLEAEAMLHERVEQGVVLRLGGIYGPGREGLLKLVRDGHASLPDGPAEYTNRFHRNDCAGALAHLLKAEHVAPLYLGVDDDPVDRNTLVEWLAKELAAPPPATVAPDQARVGRRSLSNKRCKNDRLKASGYQLAFPSFRDGYRQLIA
jgi:nucleoside-diphosphate-sugar epimerase